MPSRSWGRDSFFSLFFKPYKKIKNYVTIDQFIGSFYFEKNVSVQQPGHRADIQLRGIWEPACFLSGRLLQIIAIRQFSISGTGI